MIIKCRHIKTDGNRCDSIALTDNPYCYFHKRLHAFQRAPAPALNEPLELPVLEDRSAVKLALAQVLSALGASKLDPKRASLYLRGLQIALRNLDARFPANVMRTVKTVTHTEDGDELAPEARECERPQDCVACEKRCRWYKPQED